MMEHLSCDVLVVGAGTAGSIAALAAAEEGATVVLLDDGTNIGGMGTAGGVHGYHYGLDNGMFPAIDAIGHRVSQSLAGYYPHPDGKRLALAGRVDEAHIRFMSGLPYEALRAGTTVCGVGVETDSGPVCITAKVVIDSTCDGDVATLAGAGYRYGREWDGLANNYSLRMRCAGHDDRLSFAGGDAGWVDVRDPWDLTRAYLHGRERLWQAFSNQPHNHPLAFCPVLALRAGRYIVGEYTLTLDDLLAGRTFTDSVMLCYSNYDPHALDYANENELGWIWACVAGLWGIPLGCEVPYRCLVPKGIGGMLVASRAVSLTPDVAMAVRMQRDMQTIGEVAGVAAALCASRGVSPHLLRVTDLQDRLRARRVTFKLDELSTLKTGKWWTCWPAGSPPATEPGTQAAAGDPNPLRHLATPQEPLAMAWWYQTEPDVLALLGTPYEGKALWNIYRNPEPYTEALLQLLPASDQRLRRSAAFALALSGHEAAWPEVIACVRRRDADAPIGRRTHPRWIGALALLALHAPLTAYACMLEVLTLHETAEFTAYLEASAARSKRTDLHGMAVTYSPDWMDPVSRAIGAIMFSLRYFHKVAGRLDTQASQELAAALERLIKSRVGDQFRNFANARESVQWSLDTSAAGILMRLGHPLGHAVLSSYLDDERRYVRTAAFMRLREVS